MPPKKQTSNPAMKNQQGLICAKCHKPIPINKTVNYKKKNYHPDCFLCDGGCGKSLATTGTEKDGGGGFFQQPDGMFCRDCFASQKSPKCKGCNEGVVEKVLRFEGEAWHPNCFLCAACGKPLEGKEITKTDSGQAVCRPCFVNKFMDKCPICNAVIQPGQAYMELESGKIHSKCFKCAKCGKLLANQPCAQRGDQYLCSPCSRGEERAEPDKKDKSRRK